MRVRLIAYSAAAAVIVLSLLVLGGASDYRVNNAVWVLIVLAAPLSLLVGWGVPRRRSLSFAVGAGPLAVWTPQVTELWPVVAALVFFSIAEDRQDRPWVGWAGGLVGSAGSLIVYQSGAMTPIAATAAGGGAALLLRTWFRTRELTVEADVLRGQAAWLAQRTAVARELHDVVGHHVTAMVVQAEAGQLGDPREALRTIGDVGRTALKELDALVVHLRDPESPLTVNAPPRLLDIDELLAEPLRRSGVPVEVELQDGLDLDEYDVLAVYRIAQEALTNVARHAAARHAWVVVSRRGDQIRLQISDDGVGPPLEQPPRGSGLLGIEERVVLRGGAVELVGRPGGGSILDVTMPVTTAIPSARDVKPS